MASLKKLIEAEYKDVLYQDLSTMVDENSESLIQIYYPHSSYDQIEFEGFDIVRIGIDDSPAIEEVLVDIQIKMYWNAFKSESSTPIRVTPWANLQGVFYISEDNYYLGELEFKTYREFSCDKPLNDQLVPVLCNGDFDKVASEMLWEFYPEIFQENLAVDPHLFAERMGLTIQSYKLSENCCVRGSVFFKNNWIEILDEDTNEPHVVYIEKGTIVVDSQLKEVYGEGAYNNTILHECVHWKLHYKAALFAGISHSEMQVSMPDNIEEISDTSWMEKQARWIAPCILMPKDLCLECIKQAKKEYDSISKLLRLIADIDHSTYSELAWMVHSLKNRFGSSVQSAKHRLKYLGYEEVKGVFNYVNGRYVSHFGFSPGSLEKNQTFIIRYEDFLSIVYESPLFVERLKADNYVFFNSLVIKNNDKYLAVNDEDNNVCLTDYALSHMDECCMIFNIESNLVGVKANDLRDFSVLYHLSETPLKFSFSQDIIEETPTDYLTEAHQDIYLVLRELPNYFPDAVDYIIKYFGYTLEEAAERCDLSVEKLRDMRKNEDKNHSMEVIMQFIIGMELPPQIGFYLLEQSGHRLKTSMKEVEYMTLLISHGNKGLYEANNYLVSRGLEPLGNTAKKLLKESAF